MVHLISKNLDIFTVFTQRILVSKTHRTEIHNRYTGNLARQRRHLEKTLALRSRSLADTHTGTLKTMNLAHTSRTSHRARGDEDDDDDDVTSQGTSAERSSGVAECDVTSARHQSLAGPQSFPSCLGE